MAALDKDTRLDIIRAALLRYGESPQSALKDLSDRTGYEEQEILNAISDMAGHEWDAQEEREELYKRDPGAAEGQLRGTRAVVQNLIDRVQEIIGDEEKPEELIGKAEQEAISQYLGPDIAGEISQLIAQKQMRLKKNIELLKRDPRLRTGTDIQKEKILSHIDRMEDQQITTSPTKVLADIAKADASPDKKYLNFLVHELVKGNINYPDDLPTIAAATKGHLEQVELGLLEPELADVDAWVDEPETPGTWDFRHFVEIGRKYGDKDAELDISDMPKGTITDEEGKREVDVFDIMDYITDRLSVDEEEEEKIAAGGSKAIRDFNQSQFRNALRVYLEFLGNKGFFTRREGAVHTGGRRMRGEEGEVEYTDITKTEERFDPESLDDLYEATFVFLSLAPGLRGEAPRDLKSAMETPPAVMGKHLEPDDAGKSDRKYLLNRLQRIYQDAGGFEEEPLDGAVAQKGWESIRNWLVSGVGLSQYGLQTIKLGDWSLGVEKMPRKAREQYKRQKAYAEFDPTEFAKKFKGKGKGKSGEGPKLSQITGESIGEDMSAKGLRVYLTEEEAIASIMGCHPTADQYREISENHSRGVWLGMNEGYNDLPADQDPRSDYEPKSGYDNLDQKPQNVEMAKDISPADIPEIKRDDSTDDMMEAVASQESPDGSGVQDKGMGDAISGTDNESPDLKDVSSKGPEGQTINKGGKESGESGGTAGAKQESPDGAGLQSKGVGKAKY